MKISEILTEAWSQKYKNSINCSHPKGFSQKAHCAGKKKHNESVEMEMTCPDCGMCETHGDNLVEVKQRLDAKCWKGYKKQGTKIKGGVRVNNCVPESLDADQKRAGQVGGKEKAKPIGQVLAKPSKQHPFKGRLVGESEVNEVAPPGMEDWIKDRKADFKKRYGDKWEQVLYATAWKHKKNESLEEGYGKYWCSTDKRWKERKGPKQTRKS